MRDVYGHALIVGAGAGLSASLARLFAAKGLAVTLAARTPEDLADLARETGARTFRCDAGNRASVVSMFMAMDALPAGPPDVLVYNPSARVRGPFVEVDHARVEEALRVGALGAFHCAQEAARRMLPRGRGAVLFTGASAGVKGYPQSAAFAMAKFALRGLAQSMARELHPQGVHVGHVVVDGAIRNPGRAEPPDAPDSMLDPDAIAEAYWAFLAQDRSCWSWEVEVRPWVERF
jgi:NAD(P)-dependent dehydrogenase (short-subunit alcohol dehydrogenase family)